MDACKKAAHAELEDVLKSIETSARARLASLIKNHVGRNKLKVDALTHSDPLVCAFTDVGLRVLYENAPPYSIAPHPHHLLCILNGPLRWTARHTAH